jgi:hypothetical protein
LTRSMSMEQSSAGDNWPILLTEAETRCAKHEIPCRVLKSVERGILAIDLPNGREARTVRFGPNRLAELLKVPFERYVFLGEFQAFASYEEGWIEALFRSVGPVSVLAALRARSFGAMRGDLPSPYLSLSRDGVEVVLDKASAAACLLLARDPGRARPQNGITSLKISGLQIDSHDSALKILETVSNSVFLQFDTQMKAPVVLLRESRRSSKGMRRRPQKPGDLTFPGSEYNAKAMALYWYARSAIGMPLLQFLALYQVLEFYFPVYADEEMRRRVKQVVRNPGFRPHSEDEITRIMNAMGGRGRRTFGDERAQLRATIRHVADAGVIREFLSSLDDPEYFEEPRKTTSAGATPVRQKLPDEDLLEATADRIYEIRCRIVHSKDSDPDQGQLLPFSPEADRMGLDVELVQRLALGALVAGSRELTL